MTDLPPRTQSILVLGAGELGSAILDALTSHESYTAASTKLTLMVRPSSLSDPPPEKAAQHAGFRARGITLAAGDVAASSQDELTALFRPYTAVLHAGGMGLPAGTLLKVSRAVLAAGGVRYYMPWQHGVDYDVITREGGQGMFAEQVDVRDLLRGQTGTDWVVVSCGIFMSFLFEDFWGVVKRGSEGETNPSIQVTALNSWTDLITTTAAEDIAKCTAELLFSPDAPVNMPVYIAGDTLTYAEFADAVARATDQQVVRRVWPLEYLREESKNDPADVLKRYRVVFAEGRGLSWPKEGTWSAKRGMQLEGVEDWVKKNFVRGQR